MSDLTERYMVAPDPGGELAIWRGTPDDDYPIAAVTKHELRHDPDLWDALVAAVSNEPTAGAES